MADLTWKKNAPAAAATAARAVSRAQENTGLVAANMAATAPKAWHAEKRWTDRFRTENKAVVSVHSMTHLPIKKDQERNTHRSSDVARNFIVARGGSSFDERAT